MIVKRSQFIWGNRKQQRSVVMILAHMMDCVRQQSAFVLKLHAVSRKECLHSL